jgi:hypothetical protein
VARWAPEKVVDLSEKAWTQKSHWDTLLGECYDYALPDRNPYTFNGTGKPQGKAHTPGQDKTSRKVFDSTLMTDAMRLSNRIQTELFPIGNQWASLVPGALLDPNVKERARSELYSLQETLFAAIGLSNFDLSIAEWLLELVVAGTACMLVQRGDDADPIVFQCVSQSHVALREGAFGRIDMISRKHKMRQSLIIQHWADAKMSALIGGEEGVNDDDPEVDLVDVTYFDRQANAWYYDVLVIGQTKTSSQRTRIVERTFSVCPWIIARWSKAADEVQGRSLVSLALPDARVLSAVKSYILKQAALAIGGVFLVRNDGVINANNIRIFPGATIPVRATGGTAGASVAPLQVGGDVQLAQLVIEDLVNSIHKIMLNTGVPDIKDGVRTATEWVQRMTDLQQSLGAPFSRVLKEGIVPMLEAAIMILGEMNVIPLPASGKIKLNNGEIAVKFASPLVQGQNIREVDTLRNAMMITKEIAGDEATMLSYKVEDVGAWVGEKLGVVPTVMRDKKERGTLQQMAGRLAAMQSGGMPQVGPGAGVIPANANPQQQAMPLAA